MNLPIIVLSCLLVAQTPLVKTSSRIEEKGGSWLIHYRFNQDLRPNIQVSVIGKVSISQHTVHSEPKASVLSSKQPRFLVMETAAGKCYEILSYEILDKRTLLIRIEHNHGDFKDDPLHGKRTVTIKSGVGEFSDVVYLYPGDAF